MNDRKDERPEVLLLKNPISPRSFEEATRILSVVLIPTVAHKAIILRKAPLCKTEDVPI